MGYIEELEKRNEELQAQVSSLFMWVPSWNKYDDNNWEYHRGPIKYGYVNFSNGIYYAWCLPSQIPRNYTNIKDAQDYVELRIAEVIRAVKPP
jgi:hypothetical protein